MVAIGERLGAWAQVGLCKMKAIRIRVENGRTRTFVGGHRRDAFVRDLERQLACSDRWLGSRFLSRLVARAATAVREPDPTAATPMAHPPARNAAVHRRP